MEDLRRDMGRLSLSMIVGKNYLLLVLYYTISLEIRSILVLNGSNIERKKILDFYCLCYFLGDENMDHYYTVFCFRLINTCHTKTTVNIFSMFFLLFRCYQLALTLRPTLCFFFGGILGAIPDAWP